jgi:HK97 family phage major capsid protein
MELRDQRGKAIADARAIVDKADAEKRGMNTEESASYDKAMADEKRIKEDIDREERLLDAERTINVNLEEQRKLNPEGADVEKRMAVFRKFLTSGRESLNGEELRALTAGTDTAGGFLAAPETFVNTLIAAVKNKVFIRQQATVIPVPNAVSLGAPSLDNDVDDGDWTPEIKAVAEDTGLAFGKRKLEPHMVSKLVKISNELMRVAAMNPETIVMDRLAYKFGITEEKAFLLGSGSQQPLGIFTASNDGISTARDISIGNSSTAISFDGLIAAKYALKAQYQEKAAWIFHRDAISKIAQLKDSYNRYLWMPSVITGQPDTILGKPVYMSEYVPNTFTTGKYVGAFADFSFYWIADAYDMAIQRLNELYAVNNQVGFIARKSTDGMPVLGEAFARVTLA